MVRILTLALLALSPVSMALAQSVAGTPAGKPLAVVDLATPEGVALVRGTWRYSDVRIIEVDFRSPGPDGQPTGTPVKTYDYTPHAGGADFDDSRWEIIAPTSVAQRRGAGRLGFNWYRIRLTIPERVAGVEPTGTTVVFDTSLDDYAEVWVDGELPRALGQVGGSVVAGWNAANRLVIGRDVKPGQQIQLAVFGINGPLSNPPTNFIWIRHARLEFHTGTPGPRALTPTEVNVEVERAHPALDVIVGPNPKLFKLAEGFAFTESSNRIGFRQPRGWGEQRIGGVKVDEAGNVYESGPGGVRVRSSRGEYLGTVRAPQRIHSMAWGDEDGKTLYLWARNSLYRIRLNIAGIRL